MTPLSSDDMMIFRPFCDEKPAGSGKATYDFQAVMLPSRKMKEKNWNTYRVYKDKKEFVDVEGETVYDALVKSEVKHPYKITRALRELGSVLDKQFFLEELEAPEGFHKSEVPENGVIEPPVKPN